ANRRDISGVATERLIHLLIDPLRFNRHLVEMRFALQPCLACGTTIRPVPIAGYGACGLAFPSGGQQGLQSSLGIGNHTVIRSEYPPNLGRFNIDVNEFPTLPISIEVSGMAIRPAVANAQHDV